MNFREPRINSLEAAAMAAAKTRGRISDFDSLLGRTKYLVLLLFPTGSETVPRRLLPRGQFRLSPVLSMKICYLCNEYPPAPHGGIGSVTQVLGRALADAGHQV